MSVFERRAESRRRRDQRTGNKMKKMKEGDRGRLMEYVPLSQLDLSV